MERVKGKGLRESGEANSSSVSSAVLREYIVNLRDFIERLKREDDPTVLDTDHSGKQKLELCGYDILVKLTDHVVPRLLEHINSSIISNNHSESSAAITEDQLVELLDVVLVNLHYLPKVLAEFILLSMTQYELLQNVVGK
ncbi:hypothetical protein P3S68_024872 [Capsicum galapagoense]